MRKIEKEMLNAIYDLKAWAKGNTSVRPINGINVAVYLHGHEIAVVNTRTSFVMPNMNTLSNWPTVTTKSRLRALGVNVCTRNHVTYVDDVAI